MGSFGDSKSCLHGSSALGFSIGFISFRVWVSSALGFRVSSALGFGFGVSSALGSRVRVSSALGLTQSLFTYSLHCSSFLRLKGNCIKHHSKK